jgi:hypothetical protein
MADDEKDPKDADTYTPPPVSTAPSATGVAATSAEEADEDVGTASPDRQ